MGDCTVTTIKLSLDGFARKDSWGEAPGYRQQQRWDAPLLAHASLSTAPGPSRKGKRQSLEGWKPLHTAGVILLHGGCADMASSRWKDEVCAVVLPREASPWWAPPSPGPPTRARAVATCSERTGPAPERTRSPIAAELPTASATAQVYYAEAQREACDGRATTTQPSTSSRTSSTASTMTTGPTAGRQSQPLLEEEVPWTRPTDMQPGP
jgi:hypothetical protein